MAILDETKKPFKTLQELAASKTVEELLKYDNPAEEFQSFDDHAQKLIFTQLVSDLARLTTENAQYKKSKERTPYLDWQLYTKRHDRIPSVDFMSDVSDTSSENDTAAMSAERSEDLKSTNGHCLKDDFLEHWHFITEAERTAVEPRSYNNDWFENLFDIMTLHSHGREGKLVVCETELIKGPGGCGYTRTEHKPFFEKISSQLLYYRVTSMFGPPPQPALDGYKEAWSAQLAHTDGESMLFLGDYKGSASTRFYGTKEARESALALLNFLTGLNCPHTYGGVVAGTQA